jgi:AcrR family transcriptional regulator
MLDEFSKRNRAVRAALEIAAERGWHNVTFTSIADRTGLSLADLRRDFACKADILKAFQAEVDADVLGKIKPATPDTSVRDRLFDIIMMRFETMQPYKAALGRISASLCCRPGEAALLLPSTFDSQYWMLEGAGAKLQGPGAGLKVAGLASIYAKVFRVWLDDASPGLDHTMAALDRRLRRGEEMLAGVENACDNLCRLACGLMPRGWQRPGEKPAGESAGGASAKPAGA